MSFWIVNICIIFFLCIFLAGVVIPQILLIAFRKKLFDMPDERKIHQGVIPRLGGIAFKPVIFFSIAFMLGCNLFLGYEEFVDAFFSQVKSLFFEFCAILLLYLVGMSDDLVGVKYRAKFIFQLICAAMMIMGGLYLDSFHGLLGVEELSWWITYPLTTVVIIFIINATNLIDGIDGLASGLCGVACLFYGLIFFCIEEYAYSILSFATLGVLIPFFYYNVFGKVEHGRKIFMGDTGSLTIGAILCILSIHLLQDLHNLPSDVPNPIVLAFSPLIIPCFDVIRVYIHRIRIGESPFQPDKNHIHHRLLAVGLKQRTAMVTIVSVSILTTLLNILLSYVIDVNILLLLDIVVGLAVNYWLIKQTPCAGKETV